MKNKIDVCNNYYWFFNDVINDRPRNAFLKKYFLLFLSKRNDFCLEKADCVISRILKPLSYMFKILVLYRCGIFKIPFFIKNKKAFMSIMIDF